MSYIKFFDYAVSNPPYQRAVKSNRAGGTDNFPLFHLFQNLGNLLSKRNSMIYPGGRWIRCAGKVGMKKFGIEMITSPHLMNVTLIHGSKVGKVFPNISVEDGLSITILDRSIRTETFLLNGVVCEKDVSKTIPLTSPEKAAVIKRVSESFETFPQNWAASKRTVVKLRFADEGECYLAENHPENHRDGFVKAYINNTRGSGKPSRYWVPAEFVSGENYLRLWKVATRPRLQGSETADAREFTNLEIIDNETAVGRQKIILGVFQTFEEAKNFRKYLSTKLMREFIVAAAGRRDTVGAGLLNLVPNLQDYTNNNPIFSSSEKFQKNDEIFQKIEEYYQNIHIEYDLCFETRLFKYLGLSSYEIPIFYNF